MEKSTINMKMKKLLISLAAVFLAGCLPLLAQNVGKVELQTIDGGKTTPAEWVDGKTPYVVSFWFITCKFCIEEMDAISEVFEEWTAEKPFRFIGVCTDDTRSLAKAKAMVRSRGWDNFEFAFDVNKELCRAMNVTSCPYVFLYDKDGKLVYSHMGYSPGDEDILFEKIKALK